MYDLNVPWTTATASPTLERIIDFLVELGYHTLALSYVQSDKNIPSKLSNPLPRADSLKVSPRATLLRRCTFIFSDPSQNHRLSSITPLYDILAIRPTNEKALLAACLTITDHSIISLDLTQRYPFYFKPKPLMTAINRGIRIEICYGQCISADTVGRRNFISNILSIVRCTRGRGLIVSSEATNILACRGVADVINLLGVWSLNKLMATKTLSVHPREVVMNEGLKRSGFRGVIDVVDGGSKVMDSKDKDDKTTGHEVKDKGKRKVEDIKTDFALPTSKKAMKRAKVKEIREMKAKNAQD
ncbi:hypothetical protein K3495_g11289 [Podosphaera aphanis]|nr:hypothetical protein K3495_g11289 [Podosphaera aphanis]